MGVGDLNGRLCPIPVQPRGGALGPHPALHHFRVVDPLPQMPPSRHVALLADGIVPAPVTRSPLAIRVLQRFPVDQGSLGHLELMAAAAERGTLEGLGA